MDNQYKHNLSYTVLFEILDYQEWSKTELKLLIKQE